MMEDGRLARPRQVELRSTERTKASAPYVDFPEIENRSATGV